VRFGEENKKNAGRFVPTEGSAPSEPIISHNAHLAKTAKEFPQPKAAPHVHYKLLRIWTQALGML
jgi:hypothetical protein